MTTVPDNDNHSESHEPQRSLQDVPNAPGVYVFRNASGEVIYVGKARSLRKRLRSYFQPSRLRTADPRLRSLIHSIASYEILPVRSEAEALLLESRLIKQYAPRYNVDFRDDKRFLLIRVDPTEPFPRLRLTRIRKDDQCLYFGPFPKAGVLRETVDILIREFGLRSCAARNPDAETYRHCLEDVLKQCCRPCIDETSPEEYRQRLDAALDVLRGRSQDLCDRLRHQMQQYAENMCFEEAARLRDVLQNLESLRGPGVRTFERTTLARSDIGRERVQALQEALALAAPPNIIECFDISNIMGRFAVGSMVCFREGRPSTRDYRRYRVRTVEGADDFAMMHEVLRRRYSRLTAEGRPLPDLIVVDGGLGQIRAALSALADVGVAGPSVIGLAKKHEEIYTPGSERPLRLPRHHPGLQLLQAIRDEAHRFALAYHQSLRRRRIADSVLLEIPGVGPKRRQALLKAFGSVRRLREASPDEIAAALPGIGKETARKICTYLREHAPRSGKSRNDSNSASS